MRSRRTSALFEAIGGAVFHIGPLGSASAMKVITNMLAFVHVVAVGEALMLARRAGLDLAQAYEVIRASSGNSFVHETESQLILNGSYDVGFTMDLALKDLGLARDARRRARRPARARRRSSRRSSRAAAQPTAADAWSTMVVKLLEDEVGRRPPRARLPGAAALSVRESTELWHVGS